MIEVQPFDDHKAMSVFRMLDQADLAEAQLMRGQLTVNHLQLFAEWRAQVPQHVVSIVAGLDQLHGGSAFALLAVGNTGQSGVAQGALLARNHTKFRGALARLAVVVRREMPVFCQRHGIHRIEARCWAQHPTAGGLLQSLGFVREADMHGFGPGGQHVFQQYAFRSIPNPTSRN